jgi:hypothetical protein
VGSRYVQLAQIEAQGHKKVGSRDRIKKVAYVLMLDGHTQQELSVEWPSEESESKVCSAREHSILGFCSEYR